MAGLSGERVLVTGAAGFIGANLVRELVKRGASVDATIRKTTDSWRINDIEKDITIHTTDLTDSDKVDDLIKMIRPCLIFHTAAYGGNPGQTDPRLIFHTNIGGCLNLLKACRYSDLSLFVNTGSSSEYGVKSYPMTEKDLLEPVNLYGISKAGATMLCRSAFKNFKLPAVTLRLFSPYGRYDNAFRLIPSIILSCLKRTDPHIFFPGSVRDYIFIEDVLRAYFLLIDNRRVQGEIINIGSGYEYQIKDVATRILTLMNYSGSLLVESKSSAPEIQHWRADISKAKELLDWYPKYDLNLGLASSIDWFKNNISQYNTDRVR